MLKDLQTQHREVARLSFAGRSPVEISSQTGKSLGVVRNILNDPLCKAYMDRLNDAADIQIIDTRKRMILMNELSLDRIGEILAPTTDEKPKIPYSVILSAARDNLDRSGYQVVQRTQTLTMHLTKDDLAEMKKRAISAGAAIPEAEYKEA